MRRALLAASLLSGLLGLGCGSDGGPAGPGSNNGGGTGFTARIDGQAWASSASAIQVTGNPSNPGPGQLTISGIDLNTGRSVLLILAFVSGPGTYPLGVNVLSTPGGTGSAVVAGSSWLTPLSGAAGSVEITARTATRIAGSFSFTADAIGGATPAQRTVTDGTFDITVSSGLPDLPTQEGSVLRATLGGDPWHGATVVTTSPGPGSFSLSATTTEYSITAVSKVPIVAGNSYAIPSQVGFTVIRIGTSDSWSAAAGPDIGTWTVDSFTDTGSSGNFSGEIPALNAAGPLTVADGEFSLEFLF